MECIFERFFLGDGLRSGLNLPQSSPIAPSIRYSSQTSGLFDWLARRSIAGCRRCGGVAISRSPVTMSAITVLLYLIGGDTNARKLEYRIPSSQYMDSLPLPTSEEIQHPLQGDQTFSQPAWTMIHFAHRWIHPVLPLQSAFTPVSLSHWQRVIESTTSTYRNWDWLAGSALVTGRMVLRKGRSLTQHWLPFGFHMIPARQVQHQHRCALIESLFASWGLPNRLGMKCRACARAQTYRSAYLCV